MVPAAVAEVREAYRATVAEALAEWRAAFARSGGRYEIVMTDAPFGRMRANIAAACVRGADEVLATGR